MKLMIIEYFDLPEDFALLEVASRFRRILQYKLDIVLMTQFERLQAADMIDYLSQIQSATVPKRSRSALHNYLKAAPFTASTLLLDEPCDDLYGETLLNQQFALLTHMSCLRGLYDYKAYLQFSKSIIDNPTPLLPLHQLVHLTSREVHQRLTEAIAQQPYLRKVAPYFLKSKRMHASTRALLLSENQHVQVIDDGLEYIETSDSACENTYKTLRSANDLSLTTEQQRRQFRVKTAGAQRAFYAFESATPFGLHAALPIELNEFLQHCAPALLRNSMAFNSLEDVRYWLIFQLEVFGVTAPLKLYLNNLLADQQPSNQEKQIVYEYKRRGRFICAELDLRADLLNTLSPDVADQRLHFVASPRLTLPLPSIILELLNAALRAIDSSARHGVTLQHALNCDEHDYRRWLSSKLNSTSLPDRGIGIAALHRCFVQYSRHTLPETYRSFLSQRPVIQSHYVSAEPHQIASSILRSWRDFCQKSGMRWMHVDAHETSKAPVSKQFHLEVGSKITLRDEFLFALYGVLLEHPSLNNIAFYIYLRIATTSALRPVRQPFPENRYIDLHSGYMTVADKRVHSADERRLVVLTSSACQLLAAWRKIANFHTYKELGSEPTHGLMWLDDSKTWRHFDSKTVNTWLTERTHQLVKSHSLRHVATRRFLQSSKHFDQRLMNFLLNHSRAGVGLLDRFSTLSPALAADTLRHELERYDNEFAELDVAAMESLA